MEYKHFKIAGLLVLEDEGKKSLYRFCKHTDTVESVPDLINQTRLEVYEDKNLIVADKQILNLNCEPLYDCANYNVQLFSMAEGYVLIKISYQQLCVLLFWSLNKITKVVTNCFDMHHNNKFVAVKTFDEQEVYSPVWQIYTASGALLKFAANEQIRADDVVLKGSFLVTEGLANHHLYWLPKCERIAKDMQRIVAAKNFALCGEISGTVHLFHKRKWLKFKNVQNFGLVADKLQIFYLLKNGKYYLYRSDGSPLLQAIYPDGFDKVCYSEKDDRLLLLFNNKVYFYN